MKLQSETPNKLLTSNFHNNLCRSNKLKKEKQKQI